MGNGLAVVEDPNPNACEREYNRWLRSMRTKWRDPPTSRRDCMHRVFRAAAEQEAYMPSCRNHPETVDALWKRAGHCTAFPSEIEGQLMDTIAVLRVNVYPHGPAFDAALRQLRAARNVHVHLQTRGVAFAPDQVFRLAQSLQVKDFVELGVTMGAYDDPTLYGELARGLRTPRQPHDEVALYWKAGVLTGLPSSTLLRDIVRIRHPRLRELHVHHIDDEGIRDAPIVYANDPTLGSLDSLCVHGLVHRGVWNTFKHLLARCRDQQVLSRVHILTSSLFGDVIGLLNPHRVRILRLCVWFTQFVTDDQIDNLLDCVEGEVFFVVDDDLRDHRYPERGADWCARYTRKLRAYAQDQPHRAPQWGLQYTQSDGITAHTRHVRSTFDDDVPRPGAIAGLVRHDDRWT